MIILTHLFSLTTVVFINKSKKLEIELEKSRSNEKKYLQHVKELKKHLHDVLQQRG